MKATFFAVFLCTLAGTIRAEDIIINGVKYENARWGAATPSSVELIHKSGIVSIPLEHLPPDLQKRFNYSSKKAEDYRAATAQAASRKQAEKKARQQAIREAREIDLNEWGTWLAVWTRRGDTDAYDVQMRNSESGETETSVGKMTIEGNRVTGERKTKWNDHISYTGTLRDNGTITGEMVLRSGGRGPWSAKIRVRALAVNQSADGLDGKDDVRGTRQSTELEGGTKGEKQRSDTFKSDSDTAQWFKKEWWNTLAKTAIKVDLLALMSNRNSYLFRHRHETQRVLKNVLLTGKFGNRRDQKMIFTLKEGARSIDVLFNALLATGQTRDVFDAPDDYSQTVSVIGYLDEYLGSNELLIKANAIQLQPSPDILELPPIPGGETPPSPAPTVGTQTEQAERSAEGAQPASQVRSIQPTQAQIEEAKRETKSLLESQGIDGTKLESVRFSNVTPYGLEVIHRSGVVSIPFGKLPKEIQEKFGFDPVQAEQYRFREEEERYRQAALLQQEKELAERQKSATTISGIVTQVLPDGLYLNGDKFIVGHPQQKTVVENERLKFRAWRDGNHTYVTVMNASRTIERRSYCCPLEMTPPTVSVQPPQKSVCPACRGKGRIVNFRGSPGTDRAMCGGTGSIK